jgi:hypothetical protein
VEYHLRHVEPAPTPPSVRDPAASPDIARLPAKQPVMHGMAQAKWDSLDRDSNGWLDAGEVEGLAEWVWSSFRPGQVMSGEVRKAEARKLLGRCDVNQDGRVDEGEFLAYYTKVDRQ